MMVDAVTSHQFDRSAAVSHQPTPLTTSVTKQIISICLCAVVTLAAACGGERSPQSTEPTQRYIDQLDDLLTDLVQKLDDTGEDQQSAATLGPSVWQNFRSQLSRLQAPPALEREHKLFVEAVDELSVGSGDGPALAETFTEACRAIEARAASLGASAKLPCE